MKSSLTVRSSSVQRGFAIANLLAYAIMIAANCLSVFLPLNGKTQAQLSGHYPNLFTPAGYIFSVWGVIYMLLFGFIIYQLYVLFVTHHRDKMRVLYISPLFIGVCLCNAGWLFAWHYELITISVLIMIIHLWLLVLIHDRLSLSIAWWPLAPKIWIDIPFSIYLGWICVATIANVTAWLVSEGIHLSFLLPQVWAIIMIIIALLVGMFYVFTRNNKFVALTIVWAFYGIISKRRETGGKGSHTLVLATGLALGILLLIILLNSFRRRDPDYKPNMSA